MTELTPEQIDSMPAGPEINMLVAERVMQLGGEYQHDFQENGYGQCSKCDASNDMGAIRRGGRYCTIPDNYSEDISAAWGVIEKFRIGINNNVAAVIEMTVLDTISVPDCEVKIYGPTVAEVFANAEEMPLAICRAALKAVLNND